MLTAFSLSLRKLLESSVSSFQNFYSSVGWYGLFATHWIGYVMDYFILETHIFFWGGEGGMGEDVLWLFHW